jgi:predicted metalloenzyme YecM
MKHTSAGVFLFFGFIAYSINMKFDTLISDLPKFADLLEEALSQLNILETCKSLVIDHICIRLDSKNDVDSLKLELEKIGKTISTAVVNGREIFIIQLLTPIQVGDWSVSGIELPYPKQNSSHKNGWEHAEFVMAEAENSADGIHEAFFNTFTNLEESNLKKNYQYKLDEPQSDTDQLPNPTIALQVNGVGVKFHAKGIQEVVGM